MKTKYYEVHVFLSRNEGYSIGVKIETGEESLFDEDVIKHCVDNNLFNEDGDENQVDYVEELDEIEYSIFIG